MPRFLLALLPGVLLCAAAPATAWAGSVNACIDQCFSTFQPSEDCPYCTQSRDDCVAQCSKAGPSFGAIAYGRGSGAWGSSYQWKSQDEAENAAMENCKKHGNDCEVLVWFHDECGAVASDDSGNAYWGLGDGEGAARGDAEAKCAQGGGKNCQIQAAQCSR